MARTPLILSFQSIHTTQIETEIMVSTTAHECKRNSLFFFLSFVSFFYTLMGLFDWTIGFKYKLYTRPPCAHKHLHHIYLLYTVKRTQTLKSRVCNQRTNHYTSNEIYFSFLFFLANSRSETNLNQNQIN